ncbi:discoidin domain-containing protein [Paenibacillus barcinonensis]|uniref:Discoidin domain-containing protein n=1 Tax=Paenibacillus barcinonensis TaxID=198119 RepID=A0A2V4WTI4_PAEBA|nr:discoidin domain-containing protein [Paenibacillus barcinonensis]PYE51669.1 F5/8 type C domain-containing protein [Paenibacillus barcinonensis]QKS56029.1 discoidin domain-containing protein [Paenibacillus barcinonensis]
MLSLIPIMTSNTAPLGVASASSVSSASYSAFYAFVPDNGNWLSSTTTGWIRYQFPTATAINKYSLMHWTAALNGMPKSWTFEGSNDGTNWNILDTRTNQDNWQTKEERVYSFSNVTQYLNYRVNCSLNNGGANLSIGYLAMNYQAPPVSKILLSSFNGVYSLKDSSAYKLNTDSEKNFISYGADSTSSFNGYLTKMKDIKNTSTALGSSKTYEHSIDMSKLRVDKIVLG